MPSAMRNRTVTDEDAPPVGSFWCMRSPKVWRAGALLLVAIVAGAVFVNRRYDVAVVDEVPIAHVHVLGIDPADGSLNVATHTGSFRFPNGSTKPTRIRKSYQDTMGFTVAGPNHFLGSGHPDVPGRRSGLPTRLGLIESTDAGVTWTARSLSGDADFHGLAVAGELTYGWDSTSGRLMASQDLTNWETRSTLDLAAFGVDPADVNRVIATWPSWARTSAPSPALEHARRARSIMMQNVGLSLAIVAVLLPLALLGVLGLAVVVAVHEAAEVFVIVNGLSAARTRVNFHDHSLHGPKYRHDSNVTPPSATSFITRKSSMLSR